MNFFMFLSAVDYKPQARHIAYLIIGLLGASFLSYFSQAVQIGGFVFFSASCLILGLWKREYALYLAFLELTLGSFGYLLSIQAGGLNLSLRYAFFVIIMGLWIYDLIINYKLLITNYKNSRKIIIALGLFIIIWLMSLAQGYLAGYNSSDIFFDANSYLYLLLLLPALKYIDTKEKLKGAFKTVLIGATGTALLTFILFITFSRLNNAHFLEILYKWIRDFRIGEITPLKDGAYRIFLQSQIYLILALLFISAKHFFQTIRFERFLILGALASGAIYLSLSRSLWIGALGGLAVLFFLIFYSKPERKKNYRAGIRVLLVIFIGILAVNIISPRGDMLKNRLMIGESANDTRISQFGVLLPAIKNSPIFGYGFGKTLTFKSFDPRLGNTENGKWYTTYAFELGYLDMILKFGLFGLAMYLYFILTIIAQLLKNLQNEPGGLWAVAGLVGLLIVHIFTPYLNHPLGIGMILLAATVANIKEK